MTTFLDAGELAERWKTTKGHLANKRWRGEKPDFIKMGSRVLYQLEIIEEYEASLRDRK